MILDDGWSMFSILEFLLKNNILYFIIIRRMDSFLAYIPIISLIMVAGLFVVVIVNFSIVRKNMQKQSEPWIKNLKKNTAIS